MNKDKNMLQKIIEEEVRKILTGESTREIEATLEQSSFSNEMIGKYVVVRCRDAGVHAGVLKAHNNRECLLTESRRLWYWKTTGEGDFLSAIALHGLHDDSKVGESLPLHHLTENCEIILCTEKAEKSIRGKDVYKS